MTDLERRTIGASGLDVAYLASGPEGGPLALCLHGFPDTAWTYRHLLPALADAGYRAVAPFSRGYAPTSVPSDGRYQTGALALDAIALHQALGGDERAVLIGHDWGASTVYLAAAHAPGRWRRVVAMAVPPGPALARGFLTYDQIKRSFYMFFFQLPFADFVVPGGDLAFIARLWEDWSPGYDGAEDVAHVRESLGATENMAAALGYYRAMFNPALQAPELAEVQGAGSGLPPQPLLYLHGADDGCIAVEIGRAAEPLLTAPSETAIIEGAGHFLHLERPEEVNGRIVDFVKA